MSGSSAEVARITPSHAAELWPKAKIITCLGCALLVFLLTLLGLESFTFILNTVGSDLGIPKEQYSLISSIPTIFLGVGSFIYASLADFVKIKRIFWTGFICLMVGSVLGFFLHNSLAAVIVARSFQTFGGEVGGSTFLVLTARYLTGRARVISYGVFTGGFQLGIGSGVFAGGAFSVLDWRLLFLFPLIAVVVVPCMLWALPKGVAGAEAGALDNVPEKTTPSKLPIDIWGFALFVGFSASLLLFFSFYTWYFIVSALVCIVAFGVYIHKAKSPFISPAFFKNALWVGLSLVLFCFWLPNLSITTACSNFAGSVFGMSEAQAAFIMLAPIITAALVGVFSGPFVNKVGRAPAIAIAGACELGGFLLTACAMWAGPWAASAALCLYYAGVSLVYSPLVDSIVSAVKKEEAGRGLGLVDLTINVSSSIGYAIFVPLITSATFSYFGGAESATGGAGAFSEAAHFSSVFCTFACASALALVLFAVVSWRRAKKGADA